MAHVTDSTLDDVRDQIQDAILSRLESMVHDLDDPDLEESDLLEAVTDAATEAVHTFMFPKDRVTCDPSNR